MAYEVEGRVYLDIIIDNEPVKLDKLNAIDFLHMSCSTRVSVPMLHFRLKDTAQSMLSIKALHSGSKIKILLRAGKDGNPLSKYEFVMNSWAEKRIAGVMQYEIDAYYDVPIYWNASSFKSFEGTSFDTLNEIAKSCNIKKFEGDATNDKQRWVFNNVPWHEAARRVSERGIISESSCMQLGFDLEGTLFYKDVSKMGAPKKVLVYPAGTGTGHPIVSYRPLSFAGSKNQQSGYQKSRIEQDLFNTDLFKQHQKVAFSKESGSLQVDSAIKDKVKQSRVEFCPIDVGNVHDNYERALYQNRRVSSFFNTGLEILVPSPSGLNLFDTVSVVFPLGSEISGNVKQYEKEYLICSRNICVLGTDVVEKLELVRRTLNTDIPGAATSDKKDAVLSKSRAVTIAPNYAGATVPAGPPAPPELPSPVLTLDAMMTLKDSMISNLQTLANDKLSLLDSMKTSASNLENTLVPGTLAKLNEQETLDNQHTQFLQKVAEQKAQMSKLDELKQQIAKMRASL